MAKSNDTKASEIKAAYHAMILVDGAMAAGLSPGQAVAQMKAVKQAVAPIAGKWINTGQDQAKPLAEELGATLEAMRAVELFDLAVEQAGQLIGTPEHVNACLSRLADALLELRMWWPGQAQLSDGELTGAVRKLRSAVLAIDGYQALVVAVGFTQPPDAAGQKATAKAARDLAINAAGWPDE